MACIWHYSYNTGLCTAYLRLQRLPFFKVFCLFVKSFKIIHRSFINIEFVYKLLVLQLFARFGQICFSNLKEGHLSLMCGI